MVAKTSLINRRRTLALVVGVVGIIVYCSISGLTGKRHLIEDCYQRLLSTNAINDNNQTLPAREIVAETMTIQDEFKSFGSAARELLQEKVEEYFSTSRLLVSRARQIFSAKETIRSESKIEGERLLLAVEALDSAAAPILPKLQRQLHSWGGSTGRKVFAARLMARAGKAGTALLCDELSSPSAEVREACRAALKELLSRVSAKPSGIGTPDIDPRLVVALMDDSDIEWQRWSYQNAWIVGTNCAPITRKVVLDMRVGDYSKRTQAAEALGAALTTKASEHPAFHKLYASAFLERLSDPEPSLRSCAITALVNLGAHDEAIIAALRGALQDSSKIVRENATNALQQLSKP